MIDDTELAEHLRDADLLSDRQIEQARVLQDREQRSLYDVLIAHELVDEAPLVAIVSEVLNVASVDPREFTPDSEVLDLVPASVAFDNWALPLGTEQVDGEDRLVLAMRDPIDMMAMDEVADYTDIDIRPVLAGPRALHEALTDSYDRVEPFELDDEADDEFTLDAPSSDEGLNSGTSPGLVTSGIPTTEDAGESGSIGKADDGADEPLDTEVDSGAIPVGQFGDELADSSPGGPADSDLGVQADSQEQLAADSAPDNDDDAIGRIPVKQVPASKLEGESSGASTPLGESSSQELQADGGESSLEESDPPLDLGTPLPMDDAESSDPTEESSTVVAKAPQVGDPYESSPPEAPSTDEPDVSGSPPSLGEADDDDSPEPVDEDDDSRDTDGEDRAAAPQSEADDESSDGEDDATETIDHVDAPSMVGPDEDSEAGEDDQEASLPDPRETSNEEPSTDEAEAEDDEPADDEPEDDEDDSPLSSLRQKLSKNKSSPSTTDDDSADAIDGFVDEVADIAGSLDDASRERLESASARELARAAILALLKNGAISTADLVDGLPDQE